MLASDSTAAAVCRNTATPGGGCTCYNTLVPQTLVARLRYESEPIKGSRFIATVAPVSSEGDARALVEAVRGEMPDASHHCAAWRIATPAIERAADDGEPSGSAGRPILSQLVGRDLIDVVAVVSRYFGGTKLGVGGLVRAYGGTAAEALDEAAVVRYVRTERVLLEYGYADGPGVERALQAFGLTNSDGQYGESVRCTVSIAVEQRDALEQALRDATAGRVSLGEPVS